MSIALSTAAAIVLTLAVKWLAGIGTLKAAALFFGLEGTVLLASSLSPPHDDMEELPRGLFKQIAWSFGEGRRLAYPLRYNPAFFYGGLLLLAISFILSAL